MEEKVDGSEENVISVKDRIAKLKNAGPPAAKSSPTTKKIGSSDSADEPIIKPTPPIESKESTLPDPVEDKASKPVKKIASKWTERNQNVESSVEPQPAIPAVRQESEHLLRIAQLEKELNEETERHKKEIEVITQEKHISEMQAKTAHEKQESLEKDISSLRLANLKANDKIKSVESALATANETIKSLRVEISTEQTARAAVSQSLQSNLQSALLRAEIAEKEKQSAEEKLAFLQNDSSDLSNTWQQKLDEISFQKNAIEAQLRIEQEKWASVDEERANDKATIERLKHQIDEFEIQSANAAETFGNLEKDFSALVAAHKVDVQLLKDEKTAFIAENAKLKEEVSSLQEQLDRLNNEVRTLVIDIEAKGKVSAELQAENEALRNEADRTRKSSEVAISALEVEVRSKQNTIQSLEESNKVALEKISSLELTIEGLQLEVSTYQVLQAEIESSNSSAASSVQQLEVSLKSKEEEIAALVTALAVEKEAASNRSAALEGEIAAQSITIKSLSSDLKMSQEEAHQAKEEIAKLATVSEEWSVERKELLDRLAASQEGDTTLRSQIRDVEKALGIEKQKNEKTIESFEAERADLLEKVSSLESTEKSLRDIIEENSKALDLSVQEKNNLQEKLATVDALIVDHRQDSTERIRLIDQLEAEKSDLSEKVSSSDSIIAELRLRSIDSEKLIDQLTTEKKEQQDKIIALELTIAAHSENSESSSTIEKELHDAKAVIIKHVEQIAALEEQNKFDTEKAKEKMDKLLEEKEKELISLTEQLETAVAQCNELSSQLEIARAANRKSEHELDLAAHVSVDLDGPSFNTAKLTASIKEYEAAAAEVHSAVKRLQSLQLSLYGNSSVPDSDSSFEPDSSFPLTPQGLLKKLIEAKMVYAIDMEKEIRANFLLNNQLFTYTNRN